MFDTGYRVKRYDILNQRANPLGPCAGIHRYRTADRARDANGKLKAREATRQGIVDQARKHHARTDCQRTTVIGNNRALKLTSERNDGAAITAIGNQQIGALADDDPRHLLAIEHRHGAAKGMIAMARHKEVGLAADTITRMTRKALVLDHIRVDHARERHDGVKQTH